MSVREEDRQKNCPSRGFGLAVAAIGVGVGAALCYFYNKRQENETPSAEGSTQHENWHSEIHTLSNQNDDSHYTTLYEATTTDTSVVDSNDPSEYTDFTFNNNEDNDNHVTNSSYSFELDGSNDSGNSDYDVSNNMIISDNTSIDENSQEDESNSDENIENDETNSDENSELNETNDDIGSESDEARYRDSNFDSMIETSDDDSESIEEFERTIETDEDNFLENAGSESDESRDPMSDSMFRRMFNSDNTTDYEDFDWDVTESSTDLPSSDVRPSSSFNWSPFFLNKFTPNRVRERSWSLEECSICFDVMLKDQELMTLPCTHNFHSKCIMPWLQEQQTCPNCRKSAD